MTMLNCLLPKIKKFQYIFLYELISTFTKLKLVLTNNIKITFKNQFLLDNTSIYQYVLSAKSSY